ncbi:MAG: 2-phospho-L-lactate guanylyltransferase [Halanaeroarchaeum sp.]
MRVVIPFDANDPKTRLAPVLDPDERRHFAEAMLQDVIAAVEGLGHRPLVASSSPVDVDVPTVVDDRPLTPLVDAAIAEGTPVAVVMADLPLATPASLARAFDAEAAIAIAPGRGGGTNVLVVREPAFRTDFHGASYRDHLERARSIGTSVHEVDSFRLATDVDDPSDFVDVLVHGDGRANAWLRDAGFRIAVEGGDPRATRNENDRH